MKDIISIDSNGIAVADTQVQRAANILSIQLGALEYWPEGGIDLRYFLAEEIRFQNESFKSYLIQVLANWSINVANVIETIESLHTDLTFELSADETTTSLIAR